MLVQAYHLLKWQIIKIKRIWVVVYCITWVQLRALKYIYSSNKTRNKFMFYKKKTPKIILIMKKDKPKIVLFATHFMQIEYKVHKSDSLFQFSDIFICLQSDYGYITLLFTSKMITYKPKISYTSFWPQTVGNLLHNYMVFMRCGELFLDTKKTLNISRN